MMIVWWAMKNDVVLGLQRGIGDLIGTQAPGRLRGHNPHVILPNVAMSREALGELAEDLARTLGARGYLFRGYIEDSL